MADLLLELLSEEIPARMQADGIRELEDRLKTALEEAGLAPAGIAGFVTPRRLAVIARGLPAESAARKEERRGPRVGAPDKAIEGFLRGAGVTRDALEERDGKGGRFWFAVIAHPGEAAATILARILPGVIEGVHWPKSQRWGAASVSTASPRWVRPLRRIVALLAGEVLAFEALGVKAGRVSEGHRFMAAGPLEIADAAGYEGQMAAAHVILSPDARRALIRKRSAALATEAGLALVPDAGLEAENAGLAEWPVPLLGRFAPDFLDVPREIIELTMRTNQKYFALNAADGTLAPAFVCVANLAAPDGGQTIVHGNERVLSARLADARFFWEQDCKVPLDEQAKKLAGIVFHAKLGTMADKVARVGKLALWLREAVFSTLAEADVARAAALCKADLVTGTVGEFPEVQGVVGGHLARVQGESAAVAQALAGHYRTVPDGDVARVVALADRVDTLVSFFNAGIRPTGSRDPFALRRAAISTIEIILASGLRLSLRELFVAAGSTAADELVAFFADRLKVQQRDAGVRHDLVDAAFALGGEDDIVRLLARVAALQGFLETDAGRDLLAGYRRAANILRIEEKKEGADYSDAVDDALFQDAAERGLARALTQAAGSVRDALAREDFAAAMAALALLRGPVDAFFADVTVNAGDDALRRNRLALLAQLRETAGLVADFSRVEG